MAYVVMAYVVMAYMVMAYMVMAYMAMVVIDMAVMAYIDMAHGSATRARIAVTRFGSRKGKRWRKLLLAEGWKVMADCDSKPIVPCCAGVRVCGCILVYGYLGI